MNCDAQRGLSVEHRCRMRLRGAYTIHFFARTKCGRVTDEACVAQEMARTKLDGTHTGVARVTAIFVLVCSYAPIV